MSKPKKAKLHAFAFLADEVTPILEHLVEWDGGKDALELANMIDAILVDEKRKIRIQL